MAALQPPNRSGSRGRVPANTYPVHSQANSARLSARGGTLMPDVNENRAPPAMPRAFESMLKTTTETGDIGLFSIKPSRVPQPLNSPRRIGASYRDCPSQMQRTFQSPGATGVDDRKRLPSYTRDASSEVISMYETASQKSTGRLFEEPDYRSYSMTQTYSACSLSNHRSYTSLRSAPDSNGLLQRPRSPFAYPTRLKRPGFRPSSPALTDGGGIDYSRRTEIDRTPYSKSSPSSLYAQKRKPPLSLRVDTNRSTPSLLSQSSPPRRSSSPLVRQTNGTPSNEWQRKYSSASLNTSPARSTFSLASTVNLYPVTTALSTTTTPGKIHPPSPLYYDYTEDFDIDNYNQAATLEPPPQFRIDRTIPEDRPLSADWQSKENCDPKASFFGGPESSTLSSQNLPQTLQGSPKENLATENSDGKTYKLKIATTDEQPSTRPEVTSLDEKIVRLSGLVLGAQELSSHVEEVFGLSPSRPFEVLASAEHANGEYGEIADEPDRDNYKTGVPENGMEVQSIRTSSYSLNTHLRQFPPPPPAEVMGTEDMKDGPANLERLIEGIESRSHRNGPQYTGLLKLAPSSIAVSKGPIPSCARNGFRLADFSHQSEGSDSHMEDLRSTLENSKGPSKPQASESVDDVSKIFLTNDADSSYRPPIYDTCPKPYSRSGLASAGKFVDNSTRNNVLHHVFRGSEPLYEDQNMKIASPSIYAENDVPNFSHQIPRRLTCRSESPMLAPKPISPARQLRLKNSVPQLMKALPSLPPDQSIRAVSPPPQLVSKVELPCRFSPLIPEAKATPTGDPQQQFVSALDSDVIGKRPLLPEPVELESLPIETTATLPDIDTTTTSSHPVKLKLKTRGATSSRPTSPLDSRPWNLDKSYPWSDQSVNLGLPSTVQDPEPHNPKPPKFKLKITRASNSTSGTIRVNRESSDSKALPSLRLQNPKDLFTPTSGIDSIFRQVGRHLHTRKQSVSSSQSLHETRVASSSAPVSEQTSRSLPSTLDLNVVQPLPVSASPLSPADTISFFSDDSSHSRSRRRIRKRLSNFRSRITVPYTSRYGSQSCDNINRREQDGGDVATPPADRLYPQIQRTRTSMDTKPMRRLAERIRAQKLRAKVSEWLKGARSAIITRVKLRGVNEGDDDRVQLTTVE